MHERRNNRNSVTSVVDEQANIATTRQKKGGG